MYVQCASACLVTINIILLFSELVSSMLELDPNQRPTLAQVMSHPWLAPHLYRLATTLGAISTSKVSDYFGYLQGPTFDNKAKKGLFTQKRMPTHFKGPLSRLLLHSRIIHGKKPGFWC